MADDTRSAEFQARVEKFAELRRTQPISVDEPKAPGGRTIASFVQLAGQVAENYEPSAYLETAPHRK